MICDGIAVRWAQPLPSPVRQPVLGPRDRARCLGLSVDGQARLRQRRVLLADALGDLFGEAAPVADATTCPWCGGPHGAVAAHGAAVSVAGTDGMLVAAATPSELHPVLGIDIAPVTADPARLSELGALLGVPPEQALRRWTEVEAVLKADGRGLRFDPDKVVVQEGVARLDREPGSYQLAGIDGPDGYWITVAWPLT